MLSTPSLKRRLSQSSFRFSERLAERTRSRVRQRPEVVELRRKILLFSEFITKVETAVIEYLQPNPHARTKVAWKSSYSRAAGNEENAPKYPHREAGLAKKFSTFAEHLNDASAYMAALRSSGRSFYQLSAARHSLEVEIKEKFLYPLLLIHEKDLTAVKSKLKIPDDKNAEAQEDESKEKENLFVEDDVLSASMATFSEEKEQEYVWLLLELTKSLKDFHHKCSIIMDMLIKELVAAASQANNNLSDNEELIPTTNRNKNIMHNTNFDQEMPSYNVKKEEGIYEKCHSIKIRDECRTFDKGFDIASPVSGTTCSINQYRPKEDNRCENSTIYGERIKSEEPTSFWHNAPSYF